MQSFCSVNTNWGLRAWGEQLSQTLSAQSQKGVKTQTMGLKAGWMEGGADVIARKEFQCERILISDMDINDDSN